MLAPLHPIRLISMNYNISPTHRAGFTEERAIVMAAKSRVCIRIWLDLNKKEKIDKTCLSHPTIQLVAVECQSVAPQSLPELETTTSSKQRRSGILPLTAPATARKPERECIGIISAKLLHFTS